MFRTKSESGINTSKAIAATALKIAARHLIAAKPEAAVILTTVCALTTAGAADSETTSLGTIATQIAAEFTDVFEKDPALKADVADILDLMGLNAEVIDLSAVTSLAKTLCAVVS